MANLDAALADTRAAADELMATAERAGAAWATPRAPGKWSPSQLVEHVSRALEESAHVVTEHPSKFPSLPSFVRPLLRGLLFKRVLKTGKFPKGRAPKAFNPTQGSATPADARRRLDGAVTSFEQACRARTANAPTFDSSVFGRLAVVDYVRFQELHTRHHCRQLA